MTENEIQDTGTQLKWDILHVKDQKGNMVVFGPSAEFSELEAGLLVVAAAKLMKTKEGVETLRSIAVTYLNNMGRIISSMQAASASNWLTAAACSSIYRRLGLISPADHYRNLLWIDHIFGEMLLKDYVRETVGSLTTLVNASQTTGQGGTAGIANLATMAKVLGGI